MTFFIVSAFFCNFYDRYTQGNWQNFFPVNTCRTGMGKAFKAICERMQKVREKTDAKAFCLSWNKFMEICLSNLIFSTRRRGISGRFVI